MTRKARVEGAQSGAPAKTRTIGQGCLEDGVAAYKAQFDDWDEIKTWPLEGGLIHMAEKLKG